MAGPAPYMKLQEGFYPGENVHTQSLLIVNLQCTSNIQSRLASHNSHWYWITISGMEHVAVAPQEEEQLSFVFFCLSSSPFLKKKKKLETKCLKGPHLTLFQIKTTGARRRVLQQVTGECTYIHR